MDTHDHNADDHSGDGENGAGAGPVQRPTESVAPAAAAPFYVSRQDIHDADDIVEEDVKVPEWAPANATDEQRAAASVRVRGLTGEERDEFEGSIVIEKRDPHRKGKTTTGIEHKRMRAKLVVKSIVFPPGDPRAGQRVFDETDIGWIAQKSAAALDRVFSKAQALSGLSDDDFDDLVEGFGGAEGSSDDGSTSA